MLGWGIKKKKVNNSQKIFVSIAAYCDTELSATLIDLVNKAGYPENLNIVVCLQDTEENYQKYLQQFPFVRFLFIPYKQGKGVSYARHLIQQEVGEETFYLQLDSHHRFEKNWDLICFELYYSIENNKKILSSYLPVYDPENSNQPLEKDPYILNGEYFYDNDKLRIQPHVLEHSLYYSKPVPGYLVSAHFIFCEMNWVKTVPYDPKLYFEGEEDTLSVRTFTHGFTVYHPQKVIARHFYTRENHTRHTDVVPEWVAMHEISLQRMRMVVGMIPEDETIGIYGNGSERSVDDFCKESQIYFKEKISAKSHLSYVLQQTCWVYATGYFKRVEQRKWVEYIGEHAENIFDEIEHVNHQLILHDSKRNLWVKIANEQAFFKTMGEERIGEWVLFTEGLWESQTLISYQHSKKTNEVKPIISFTGKKIGLVSLRTPQTMDWAFSSELNQRHYCKLHGYTYILYNDIPIKAEIPHWNKVAILLEHLSKYDWLVWIDSDAIFTKINQKLEEVIAKESNKDLLLCDDIGGWQLNTGVMFLKNTEWTKNIFLKLWCMEHVPHSKAAEQSSLIHLLQTEDPQKEKHHIFSQTEFNTHPKAHTGNEFVLHMMGLGGEERLKTFTYWNNKLGVKS